MMIDDVLNSPEFKGFESATLIGFQKSNWGQHSGMNSILNVVPARRILMEKPVPGVLYRMWKPFRKWFYARNPYYEINSTWLETKVGHDWLRHRNHIYHFLSGDNEFLFSGSLKRLKRGNRLVCSFHGLGAEASHIERSRGLQRIDGAIVVSSNMIDFYQSLFGSQRVFCVPHGVDTGFWKPSESKPRNSGPQILFVGSHLRDFDVLRKTIQIASKRDPFLRFHAVVSREHAAALKDLTALTIYPRISDEELRRLYQTTDLLICPLLECTASNSLLEALACGLPIVATDIGGIRDYVNDQTAVLTPFGDADAMMKSMFDLLQDPSRLLDMSIACRKRALELDWMVIAKQFAEVYRKILSRVPA